MNKVQKDKKRIQKYIAYFRKLEIELKSKLMVAPSANSNKFSSNYEKRILRKLKENKDLGHYMHKV